MTGIANSGEVFYFSEADWTAMNCGIDDWDQIPADIEQSGSGSFIGAVYVDKSSGDIARNAAGHRETGKASGQWAIGDIIKFA